jgi:uncharacterized membrane protein
MSIDTILKLILEDAELRAEFWPEITNPEAQNMITIGRSDNIYLKYIYAILSENTTEQTRKNQISHLLNN